MQVATKFFQKPLLPYYKGRNIIKEMENCLEGYNDFELITSRTIVGPDNALTPDWIFENAVYKIQTNKAHELNADERESVAMLELQPDRR